MLLQLLVQQPAALVQVIERTPLWVWGLLAALLVLGGSQWFDRGVSLRRALLMPAAMTGLSAYGVLSAFGQGPMAPAVLGAWLGAALVVAAVALWLQPQPAAATRYDAQTRCFFVPGSAAPLALILGIFLTKYLVGVELAMQPTLARDTEFALQIAVLYGLFSGVFAARAMRLWRLARRSGTQLPGTTAASA